MSQPAYLVPFFADASPTLERAWRLARLGHADTIRKGDGNPFLNHVTRVAAALYRCEARDVTAAAGLLHDLAEDTHYTLDHIRKEVSPEAARLVAGVSEDKSLTPYAHRKAEHLERLAASDTDTRAIFLADKLCNLKDMLVAYEVEGPQLADRFNAPLEEKLHHAREHTHIWAPLAGTQFGGLVTEYEQTLRQLTLLAAADSLHHTAS